MSVACTVACTVPLAAAPSIEWTFVLVEEDVFIGCLRLKRRCVVLAGRQMKQRGVCEWVDRIENKRLKCMLSDRRGQARATVKKAKVPGRQMPRESGVMLV